MEELIQIFLEESREILQQLENDLLQMEQHSGDSELMKRIFRAAHTIKGSAGLTGLDQISTLAHRLEDVLDYVRTTGQPMSTECYDTVFRSMDMLNQMVDMTSIGQEIPADLADELKVSLNSYLPDQVGLLQPAEVVVELPCDNSITDYLITMEFKLDLLESGHDPLRFIEELQAKGEILAIELNHELLPDLLLLDPYHMYLKWSIRLKTKCTYAELEDVFVFVLDDNYISIEEMPPSVKELDVDATATSPEVLGLAESNGPEIVIPGANQSQNNAIGPTEKSSNSEQLNTIRVDIRRLESVLNLIAELVISQSQVKELVSRQAQADVEVFTAFESVDKIVRRLQEEVMKTSMIPIGPTFTRFQRMVRDMAGEMGKDIQFQIQGQETELDKRVIEQITDPLKHMLRNSIDHGLETPEERVAKGKPPTGTVWLKAAHQEGHVVIEVWDDGKGLSTEKIREKAIKQGLINEEQKLSMAEVQKLIMAPGFTTAERITDISGRGVGLDVVATNIQALRGSIEIESEKDQGTRFIIKLPLTLAIIDGMMVTVGEEKFILPLTSIVEFIKAEPKDVRTIEGKGLVVHVRDDYLPMVALSKIINIQAHKNDPTEGLLAIIKDGKKKIALLVDDILGQEQVVTKSLKDNYQQIEGIAGATIMGDGRVAMILDVPSLVKIATR